MSLSVGIVGLPNVGKSTLFNALLKKQQAYVANFPFATIEPNIGVVPVPDERLNKLSPIYNNAPIVPATCEFVDIAGLIEGASKGEGLGNKFLNHIRQVDAICFVLRAFSDPDIIKQGVKDPKSDLEILRLELDLADAEMEEKHLKKKNADTESLQYFKDKPFLVVLNVDETDVAKSAELEEKYANELGVNRDQIVAICAKVESELADLLLEEQKEYLKEIGASLGALDKLIQKAFKTLGLITFLTAGEKEVRAWTINEGITAQDASGVIHTDFMNKFIKADVCDFNDFVNNGGWKQNRELGKVRSEGRDYIVKDGDVIEFKIGS
ncbi:MAG: GTP-binding protein YchF [Candidatus Woesebacteria bacterium GW2011_GWA1_33_30]|uniref:GTP-binding protein YchF n=1 Tax=Candidatus Woesebacteria bacterium GW2011_GWA2_33_28 TaxID=1618561 RepID=A0A0G0CX59_9BACT|nr:MAG: GTP-binding protein YchF [Candidatus Woesebacteria bacterium GW2011_GWA2_33_28]KKP48810.1 MAG: GTP-binding protein YchF [Candidatus Woesebacteria bacterium GW2011_GWA1_33_30]KKP50083.1 MAG: GTP-binding protein YchF [Microgenomates group bacterium GW2011_GWC1_33_32]KKP51854.1 MAG: GTP-binding protein YchF [Candidatus Woesebacteria bacterium GW2011_GWB1_33_38]KKP57687.1 MAG: GTP-binding protein YchF [Microgenomates group bacterium GW2011_GWD1_33_9]